MLDGKRDGKIEMKSTTQCAGCARSILASSLACPYCGEAIMSMNPFAGA